MPEAIGGSCLIAHYYYIETTNYYCLKTGEENSEECELFYCTLV